MSGRLDDAVCTLPPIDPYYARRSLTATACIVQSCTVSCYEFRVRSNWENLDPSVHFDRDDIASRSNDCCTSINISKTLYSLSLLHITEICLSVCLSVCLYLHSPLPSLSLSSPFLFFFCIFFFSFPSQVKIIPPSTTCVCPVT